MEARIGRQTPTTSVVLPYEQTLGEETIKLYESTGRKAQEWQKLSMMASCLHYVHIIHGGAPEIA